MGKQQLKGKDLRKIGMISDQTKSLAINITSKHFKHCSKSEILDVLSNLVNKPEKYKNHKQLASLADKFLEEVKKENHTIYQLKNNANDFKIYGKKFIDQNTINQMSLAMRLPIAEKGALMPDAHVGYGLPIGGVLATKNEVIPYAIGLDIGCRMALSVFDVPFRFAKKNAYLLKKRYRKRRILGLKI